MADGCVMTCWKCFWLLLVITTLNLSEEKGKFNCLGGKESTNDAYLKSDCMLHNRCKQVMLVSHIYFIGLSPLTARAKVKRKFMRAPIPYYPGVYSCSLHLLSVRTRQLNTSGDVNPNPWPAQNPCPVCNKAIAKTHRALPCAGCSLRCHIGKKCGNIPVIQYKRYSKSANSTWYCPTCIKQQTRVFNEPHNTTCHDLPQVTHATNDPTFHFPRKGFSMFHLNCRSLSCQTSSKVVLKKLLASMTAF